jgi:hypothetical protein
MTWFSQEISQELPIISTLMEREVYFFGLFAKKVGRSIRNQNRDSVRHTNKWRHYKLYINNEALALFVC